MSEEEDYIFINVVIVSVIAGLFLSILLAIIIRVLM